MIDIAVDIDSTKTTHEGISSISLVRGNGTRLCHVDLEYSRFAHLPQTSPRSLDFLLLASAVYSIDKLVDRGTAVDAWTREITLTIPVSGLNVWKAQGRRVSDCLSFLTGDNWSIKFVSRKNPILSPSKQAPKQKLIPGFEPNVVSLFSGGLDSLIGVIDWLETRPSDKLLLVGHHDGEMTGPLSDQKALKDPIAKAYPGRTRTLLARIGHNDDLQSSAEITLRGRSLAFIAMGIYAASAYGPSVPMLIPENGTIALNVPLTPSRRGSCSTRTAHPYFLSKLQAILGAVGISNPIVNPLEASTKGQAVKNCKNRKLLKATAELSVSCAKRGHKIHFTHREAKSCGRCMPCIYRRAALNVIGWDDELYGDDICNGEIDPTEDCQKPSDLRACLSFLRKNPTEKELALMLMANGSLDSRKLKDHVKMIQQTMNEIRDLIRVKGNKKIKRLAGV